ncbi:precorrin-6y C5,15-methyltransferase (decarboxylating) subunit CbiE [Clostridium sp. 'deep sea']|uniref:precorrin-6y C5,15-methyltransferase (decarboxylating) subunit CbiE n=1 Tax=Clostridium sp. 'deep sea' TaxID=2779445 RepID=UPI00189679E9|nr:precorrin-6y C5,15-methyltransferase (decarboxylating) subunit CbiE [Clostridium sp. 'deep sea']QOR36734.1 precorrin-6y C5,15-methyltransferase (decarboxylating) subunit CbiE [Clostridium sp. 'deep sea']
MPKVRVVGLGPGSRDYILPISNKIIKDCQVVIAAKRNLASIEIKNQQTLLIDKNLTEVKEFILSNKNTTKIAVVVSGDTGFYSLLNYLKGFLQDNELTVYPGISSMQYMFAKIKQSYQQAHLTSLHGRANDIIDKVKIHDYVGVLTDKINSPAAIASLLINNDLLNYRLYIGENLSYENEHIHQLTVPEAMAFSTPHINTVIICKIKE